MQEAVIEPDLSNLQENLYPDQGKINKYIKYLPETIKDNLFILNELIQINVIWTSLFLSGKTFDIYSFVSLFKTRI